MNPTEIKKAIALAKEAVNDIMDQELKLRTYEIILNNVLGKKNETNITHHETFKSRIQTNKSSYELLASKINCNPERIEDLFDINDDVFLLFPIKRDSTLEEQVLFLLVYLTVKTICFDQKEIRSSILREKMAMKQVANLKSLSTNIKKIPSLIIHKLGKKGSTKTSYRITHEGISKGLSIIQQITSDGSLNNLDMSFLGPNITKKKKRSSGLTSAIDKLISEGLFNQPVAIKDVVIELRKNGFFNRRQDVDAHLRKVLLGDKLLREKRNGLWHYMVKR